MKHFQNIKTNKQVRPGFTIMELMVVISIIVAVLAMIIPVGRNLLRYQGMEAAMNTIAIGATATRAYSTRDVADLGAVIPNASYSGTAMIFTPGGEIRLVENDQTGSISSPNDFTESRGVPLNAYGDIPDRDYIILPNDAGVVGIMRKDDAATWLLTPPFAVRFSERGNLVSSGELGTNVDGLSGIVYYDGNYDGAVIDNSYGMNRGQPYDKSPGEKYNSAKWDQRTEMFAAARDDSSNIKPGFDAGKQKYRLPFEMLETCVGIYVYSRSDLAAAGLTVVNHGDGETNAYVNIPARDWIYANGKAVFFGRYSGTLLKEPMW